MNSMTERPNFASIETPVSGHLWINAANFYCCSTFGAEVGRGLAGSDRVNRASVFVRLNGRRTPAIFAACVRSRVTPDPV